jgi:hypothetical protein
VRTQKNAPHSSTVESWIEKGDSEIIEFSFEKHFLTRESLPEIPSKFFHDIAPLKTPAKIAEIIKNHALS